MDYSSLAPIALVQLCAEKDPIAWEEFIYRYQRPIGLAILRVLRRWGEPPTVLLDDLLQETYVALCANECRLLRQFVEKHPDSLNAMLRVVAANVTHDQIRARRSQKRGKPYLEIDLDSPACDDTFSNQETEKIEREVQMSEIERLLRGAPKPISSERDRSIFHFLAALSIGDEFSDDLRNPFRRPNRKRGRELNLSDPRVHPKHVRSKAGLARVWCNSASLGYC